MAQSAAIMQPTYLPWVGYFALMARADLFVFLDSVQFARRSWQQRNRIKTAGGEKMLTVPVIKKSRRDQLITEVEIDRTQDPLHKHYRIITAAYQAAPFFDTYAGDLHAILERDHVMLVDLNLVLINWMREHFAIRTKLLRSSEMNTAGAKADLLATICQQLGTEEYISPKGSAGYLEASTAFADRQIAVRYHEYEHPVYQQLHGDFLPFMSALDLLFNHGPRSGEILLSGNR